MFETIVVGTDGSKGALEAVSKAGQLAKSFGLTSIHVVTACAPYSSLEIHQIEASLPAEFHGLISPHLRAEDRFVEAADILKPLGIEAVDHEAADGAATGILDVARDVGADLIVVGARGLGPVGRFFRGSVSTRVAHHAPCSVLIVEHDD